MANYDNAKIPLLTGFTNTPALKPKEDSNALTRRRFCRSKSSPSPNSRPSTLDIVDSNPPHPAPNASSKKPTFLYVSLILALYLIAGTISFILVGGQIDGKKTNDIVDALYFCIVTMTTVGYGDLVPITTLSKLLACLFVFSGMAIVGMILSQAADYFVEKHEALMARAFHLQDKASPAEILKEVETNKTKYKFMTALALLIVLITLGTLVLTLHEGKKLIDAFYCVCATITTLGYGDESFATIGGRIFAVFWILSSTICLAQFFFYLSELYTESRQKSLLRWILGRKLTFADIEAADLDNDKVVSAAEFILHKLKEMDKISDGDIASLMECFRNLDVDESGTLTAADIVDTA